MFCSPCFGIQPRQSASKRVRSDKKTLNRTGSGDKQNPRQWFGKVDAMQGPPPTSTYQQAEERAPEDRRSRSADRVYQTVTIAAILLVLGSLWLF